MSDNRFPYDRPRGPRSEGGLSQPRLLLKRLHAVMAAGGEAEDKLNRIVRVVAQNMVAEVCSIYLLRAGSVLELFATEGLKTEAVHQTRLTIGEGLVGSVAERGLPINLSEATQHPRFAYRPETGEEIYHSFLGVPVMRLGRVTGVLTVQNVAQRRYSEEEVEVLQTISMVLAELTTSLEVVSRDELSEGKSEVGQALTLDGIKLADGVSAGVAVLHRPQATVRRTIADNVGEEMERLDAALKALVDQFEDLLDHPDLAHGGEHRDVLETYRMFVLDRGWQEKMRDAVQAGLTAEAAVARVQQENRRRMLAIRDPYLRERANDFDDLAGRLIRTIQGDVEGGTATLTEDSILIARDLGPAELMDYDRDFLKGVVLEEGSATAHMAIIARAMGLPAIGRVRAATRHISAGEPLIIDSGDCQVYVRPDEDIQEAYKVAIQEGARRQAEFDAQRALPAETLDGEQVTLLMNAGILADLPNLEKTGAEGIGLFRTEFQFMISNTLPKVDEQTLVYKTALDAAADRPVVFRTLDVGGDKQVPFLPRDEEENPAMGWRAIRIALDRPALLRYQLRALLIAAEGRTLHVMFPMIAEVHELKRCKALLAKEVKRLTDRGQAMPNEIRVGCMLEVPSLAWQMDLLVKEIDFLSIGTNDLMQFFFACDRGSPRLAGRYDLLAPAVLRFLADIVGHCQRANVPVTLCGEMGARPLEALALIGLGLRRLSVSPSAIGPVKRMIRSVKMRELEAFIHQMLGSSAHSIRDSLRNYAQDHGVNL